MGATPKTRRSSSKKKRRMASYRWAKAKLAKLVTLPSGKKVPSHMVTPENPTKNGITFVTKKK